MAGEGRGAVAERKPRFIARIVCEHSPGKVVPIRQGDAGVEYEEEFGGERFHEPRAGIKMECPVWFMKG
jgi:hypothetical protein